MPLEELLVKCRDTGALDRAEILRLLSVTAPEEVAAVLACGDAVRRRHCGPEVHVRALVEFSNHCRRNCLYCGIRRGNRKVKRYRMGVAEVVDLAVELDAKGFRTIVLQSGEDPWYRAETLADMVRGIKQRTRLAVTLSVGERRPEEYQLMREAGADRFLLRHEAANPGLYAALHPDSKHQERQECLRRLRELGFQVGAGCMVGVPGQALEHLADDIEFIRDFQPDMVGIGPFISHPDTPLAGHPSGDLDMCLKMVALARIVTRDALIPATTAIGSIREDGRELALKAGADVVMPNYTPMAFRADYEIYPNKRCVNEDPSLCHACLQARILSVDRTVADHPGHSRKKG